MKAQACEILAWTCQCPQADPVSEPHSAAATEIGRRIRAARQQRGLSLEDLGALADVAWTNVGKIERGVVSPTVETVVRLASAIELDPGELVTGITADMYGARSHRYTARDFLAERDRRG